MEITDAQVHIWAASTAERPWEARYAAHREVPLTAADLAREMDEAHVDRVVLVPAGWEGDRNDLALAAAQARPHRFAVMGRLDIEATSAPEQVRTWLLQPGMLGMRLTFKRPQFRHLLEGGGSEWLWSAAEAAGIPLMVLVDFAQVPLIERIARDYPRLRLTLDHLALTTGHKDAQAFAGFDAVLALAQHANIAVKASALPCYTNDTYPFRALHPQLRRVFDAFGARRMFWGSDLSRSPVPYRQQVTWFTEALPWLAGEDLAWVMGRGIREWLGWP